MATPAPLACALALAIGMSLAQAGPAAAPRPASSPSRPQVPRVGDIAFDLPAQPLPEALEAFGAMTGWSGFYQADTVAGRRAPALAGRYTPEAALRLLLEGSGLAAHLTAPEAFVIEALAPVPIAEAVAAVPRDAAYDGLLQSRVREIFCRDARTAPAGWRVALSFHVDGQGRVERPMLLDSTGDAARDGAILQAMREVHVGRPPAGDAAQPFVMLIVPSAMAAGRDCGAAR
ncbi:secretin and TonB N-terminal domain-containing protein [Variovorax boronicumulans]|uniref:secretin and TonB N-terminal domain-containing protein n=1 Tax=Variovorax boronicumulans TaxID=436515 RepID=UPI001C588EEA